MQTTCPKCNRPVRPGAKFCGFCGATLTPVSLSASPPRTKNGAANCPHCNAPLRPGVKFCANCGKPVNGQKAAQATPPAPPAGPPPASPKPAPEPAGKPSPARARRARRSRGRYIIYLGVLFVICLVLAIPAVIFGRPLVQEWLVTHTPTSTVTETSLPPTNTSTPKPSTTFTPTSTATIEPSPTVNLEPTQTATNTPPLQPTFTNTPLPPLLEDDFSQDLEDNWEIWGTDDNITVTSDPNPALLLSSTDVETAGVSSLADTITLEPGLLISFTVNQALQNINTGTPELRFAWTPGTDTPPDTEDPLPLELLIRPTALTFTYHFDDGSSTECPATLDAGPHTYRIEVSSTNQLRILVDDEPICQNTSITIPLFSLPSGRIHFSGSGLVDDVFVDLQP